MISKKCKKKRDAWKLGEVTPRNLIYGFIIFTMVILGGIGFMSGFAVHSPTFINNDKFKSFNDTFNQYGALEGNVSNMKDNLANSRANTGVFGMLDGLINVAWNSLKTIFTTFSFITTAFTGISSVFGLPVWVGALVTTMAVVMIVFSLYSLIFQGKT
jgi:hypothetical protein